MNHGNDDVESLILRLLLALDGDVEKTLLNLVEGLRFRVEDCSREILRGVEKRVWGFQVDPIRAICENLT